MPFIGLLGDERVIPEGVEDGTDVICPECGDRMFPWGPSKDGTARHFKHHSGNECATVGGESARHRKLKSIAVSKLRTVFGDRATVCEPEVTLEAPESSAADRRADALVRFNERDSQLGRGVIIEVQYKNKGKNKGATELDYLSQDYSVVWVTTDDYESNELAHTEQSLRIAARHAAIRNFSKFVNIPADAPDPPSDTLDMSLSDRVVPATILKDWVTKKPREYWQDKGWNAGFRSADGYYCEKEYVSSGLVGSLPLSPKPTARLPEPVRDLLRYNSDGWIKEDENKITPSQTIVFDPSLPFSFVQKHTSKPDELTGQELDPPPTRFDDVQCLGCGNYEYAPNAGPSCPTCGKEYDWQWNINTGRIDKESLPGHVSLF